MDFKNVFKDIKENIEHDKRNEVFEQKTSIEEYAKILEAFHITFDSAEVLTKYDELGSIAEVASYYFDKYAKTWDLIDDKHELEFNSGSLYYYIREVVAMDKNVEDLLDPYFFEEKMDYIANKCKKEDIQTEFVKLLAKMIKYADQNGYSEVYDIEIATDFNEFFKTYIKRCYKRDKAFNEAIKAFYDKFADIDQSAYKVK